MLSIGKTLQRARQDQGFDLPAVAAQTKINLRYLESIEADDRKALPSGFFYRSFIHQYAELLKLDVQQLNAEVDRVLSDEAPLPLPGQESTTSKNVPRLQLGTRRFDRARAMASLGALLLVVGGCSGVYWWWHQAASAKKMETAPLTVSVTPADTVKQPAPLATAFAPPRIPSAVTAGYKVLLDLIAKETTWLQVSSDGKQVFSGVLSANQSKTVEGREFAKVRLGNAAGIDVRLNGKMLGPLGTRGQVLVVVFTPNNFQIVAQAPREGDD